MTSREGYFANLLLFFSQPPRSTSADDLTLNITFFFLFSDIPAQVPPLTPGTNKKMTEALKASFASWEKEQEHLGIPKGKE